MVKVADNILRSTNTSPVDLGSDTSLDNCERFKMAGGISEDEGGLSSASSKKPQSICSRISAFLSWCLECIRDFCCCRGPSSDEASPSKEDIDLSKQPGQPFTIEEEEDYGYVYGSDFDLSQPYYVSPFTVTSGVHSDLPADEGSDDDQASGLTHRDEISRTGDGDPLLGFSNDDLAAASSNLERGGFALVEESGQDAHSSVDHPDTSGSASAGEGVAEVRETNVENQENLVAQNAHLSIDHLEGSEQADEGVDTTSEVNVEADEDLFAQIANREYRSAPQS